MTHRLFTTILLLMAIPGCSRGSPASATNDQTPGKRQPFSIGINVGSVSWWSNNRIYANLAFGNHWQSAYKDGPVFDVAANLLTNDGWMRPMLAGQRSFLSLNHPNFRNGSVEITCRYDGKATFDVYNVPPISDERAGKGSYRFRWQTKTPTDDPASVDNVVLIISDIDPVDPIRNIDCRETAMDPAQRFNPEFVASLRGYKVMRYLAGMNQSMAPTLTWSTRKKVTDASAETDDGMPIEDLVALANTAQVSPWFILPWQADDDYQRRFADYVHANLDRKLVAHVELANEVWNYSTPIASQVQREGVARKLSANAYEALFRRYGERLTEVMKIWTATYKDRPKALVRIAATQAANPDTSKMVLSYADTAKWVDALAIAPYFGYDTTQYARLSDPSRFFEWLDGDIDHVLDDVQKQRAVADNYGLRLITYEAGQHIVMPNEDLGRLRLLMRDARMDAAYRRYIDGWRDRTGDMIVLMQDVAAIGGHGAWGLREYLGQPLEGAPKARAVAAYLPAENSASK
jgi:hypothetical protein